MTTSSSDTFYDSLAEFYDLIFEDWGASMQRQGRAIAELIGRLLPDGTPPIRVLDAAAGIGDSHYDATFHVVVEGETSSVHSVTTRFHAFSVSRLLELLAQAGFQDCRRFDETVYQPIISAKKPGSGPSNPNTQ